MSLQANAPIMAFDLEVTGHHAGYIQNLARYWIKHHTNRQLIFVVSPQFFVDHPKIAALAHQSPWIRFKGVEQAELPPANVGSGLLGRARLFKRAIQEWKVMCRYAQLLDAAHCVVLYLDALLQAPIAMGLPAPCPISGIYFRPTFHYPKFANYRASAGDRIRAWRQTLVLAQATKHNKLASIMTLDPYAVPAIQQMQPQQDVRHLPDPVQVYPSPFDARELRKSFNIAANKRVLLLFGVLSPRKGTLELLKALPLLSPKHSESLCVLFAGPIPEADRAIFEATAAEVREQTSVQLSVINEFIADEEIQPLFQLSDLVLAPYQKHVGMSAILVRAAAAQRPVLSSNYGLMGEITHRHSLGWTVDSSSATDIAREITAFLEGHRNSRYDKPSMQAFAKQNTAEVFAKKLLEVVNDWSER